MGHLMEEGGGEQEEKNNTFGGLDFDVCNPNSCLGGDTLTVNTKSLIKANTQGEIQLQYSFQSLPGSARIFQYKGLLGSF